MIGVATRSLAEESFRAGEVPRVEGHSALAEPLVSARIADGDTGSEEHPGPEHREDQGRDPRPTCAEGDPFHQRAPRVGRIGDVHGAHPGEQDAHEEPRHEQVPRGVVDDAAEERVASAAHPGVGREAVDDAESPMGRPTKNQLQAARVESVVTITSTSIPIVPIRASMARPSIQIQRRLKARWMNPPWGKIVVIRRQGSSITSGAQDHVLDGAARELRRERRHGADAEDGRDREALEIVEHDQGRRRRGLFGAHGGAIGDPAKRGDESEERHRADGDDRPGERRDLLSRSADPSPSAVGALVPARTATGGASDGDGTPAAALRRGVEGREACVLGRALHSRLEGAQGEEEAPPDSAGPAERFEPGLDIDEQRIHTVRDRAGSADVDVELHGGARGEGPGV